MTHLTELIGRVNAGDTGAQDELFGAAYGELRRLARSRLREGGRNTYLDTTALVHESYLKFLRSGRLRQEDRRAFFAYASLVMRSVIIDAVRERQAERRGGDRVQVTLDTGIDDGSRAGEQQMLQVHEALIALEAEEPRQAKLIEMRYFGGYSDEEIAAALGVTDRTVRREWLRAKLTLRAALRT